MASGLPLLAASHVSRPKLLPWICLLLCLLNVIVAVYQHSYAFSRRESVNLFSVFVDVGQRNVEAEKGETVLKHVLFVVGRFSDVTSFLWKFSQAVLVSALIFQPLELVIDAAGLYIKYLW